VWYKVGKPVIPVDISVPETLRAIHKPRPLIFTNSGLEFRPFLSRCPPYWLTPVRGFFIGEHQVKRSGVMSHGNNAARSQEECGDLGDFMESFSGEYTQVGG
jgi:hypothetical protein